MLYDSRYVLYIQTMASISVDNHLCFLYGEALQIILQYFLRTVDIAQVTSIKNSTIIFIDESYSTLKNINFIYSQKFLKQKLLQIYYKDRLYYSSSLIIQNQHMNLWFFVAIFVYVHCYDWTKLEDLIRTAIADQVFPGAVVAVANENQVLYMKPFGYQTYRKDLYQVPVIQTTKYDVASVTKIMATTYSLMSLYGSNSFNLNDLVSKYIPNYDTNKKGNTTVANLLLHNAGLPYDYPGKLPSSKQALIQGITFMKPVYEIGKKFQYSNLGFIMLGQIIQKIGKKNLSAYCSANVIHSGLRDTGFNPTQPWRCAPTQYDTQTRKKIVRGQAHERLAYLMRGVAGHSGFFTTAGDVIRFLRILLNKGKLPNQIRIIGEKYVDLFTTRVEGLPYQNVMGYGFDTQCPGTLMKKCFGHDGSTGIMAWVDTDRKMAFAILSNRGHPNVNNDKFFGKYYGMFADTIVQIFDAK